MKGSYMNNNPIYFVTRFIIKNLKWFIIGPLIVGLLVIYFTRNRSRTYEVNSTVYTGFASGFSVDTDGSTTMDYFAVNNANDNLISITKSRSTLERVSVKLFAQAMMYGKEFQDNKYITARSYRALRKIVPDDIVQLIDSASFDRTVANLMAELESGRENFMFQLINWYHPHYSLRSLSKIRVNRVGQSDMLEISYEANDPAICYQTVVLINKELVDKYRELRFSETNDVVGYFERELAKAADRLLESEDDMMRYSKENRVINYDEQTKSVASLFEKFELRYQEVLLSYQGAKAAVSELETKMEGRSQMLRENTALVNQLRKVQDLTATITRAETFLPDSARNEELLEKFRRERQESESSLRQVASQVLATQGTKEGIGMDDIVLQWLSEMVILEKSKAELDVMRKARTELNDLFAFYSPVGATLKRKEREIGINEQSYLSLLHSLSLARLKQKSLQMSSASLRVVTAPVYPLDSKPTKRKIIVLLGMMAAFIFTLAYLLLIEFLDRTLRNPPHAASLTGLEVLGVIPSVGKGNNNNKGDPDVLSDAAAKYAAHTMVEQCTLHQTRLINVLSTDKGDGKTYFSVMLEKAMREGGFSVIRLEYGRDFDPESREYRNARSAVDLMKEKPSAEPDYFIVEHPDLIGNYLAVDMLKNDSVNLLVGDALRGWREADQVALDKLKAIPPKVLYLYLNRVSRIVLEGYVGLLPPYTLTRKLMYKLYNLEFSFR